jgi:hypothetical protein
MTVWPFSPDGAFPQTSVLVPLAWQPRGAGGYRPVLHYHFGRHTDTSIVLRGDTILLRRQWPGSDSAVLSLDVATETSILPSGIDNTTDEYRVRLVVPRSSVGSSASFSLPKVVNALGTAALQMAPAIDLAHSIAGAYGLRAMWGLELGQRAGAIAGTKWQGVGGAGGHLTMFLPEDLSPALEGVLTGTASSLGALAQSLGGLTAIAHPFGTSTADPVGSELEQREEARQLGAFLVQNEAWRAALIEVGSIRRGLVGIRGHLFLLDYLWASGLRLCGVGVTDAHGGLLVADPVPGSEDQYNFVTWIGGVDRFAAGAQLVAELRSCNVSFGDPFHTRGGIWLDIDTTSTGRQVVSFDVGGVSPSADFFLYEAEIDSTGIGHDPTYRRYGHRVTWSESLVVGACRPGFARLEAWARERPIAFSNVVMVAPDPSACPGGAKGR